VADIVNLNKARKAKAKTDAKTRAAENRTRFGETKADKTKRDAERTLQDKRLDGHEREEP
jgi:hypothetical protein